MLEQCIDYSLVNGEQGDPAVYGVFKRLGEGFLFDLGRIDSLSGRELLRVRHVFVSHTHVDHFIGFDHLLRVNIPHRRIIHVWGPFPFIARVQAKLRAYTWNLIDNGHVQFYVHELDQNGMMREGILTNSDNFSDESFTERRIVSGECFKFSDGSILQAVPLNHKGISSLAYRIQALVRPKVQAEAISKLGLKPGPWVAELQQAWLSNRKQDSILVGQLEYKVGDLGEKVFEEHVPESLVYVTDISFDDANLSALVSTFARTDVMVCESSFMDCHLDRAIAKAHLTTKQAAIIACALKARKLTTFHVSSIYGTNANAVIAEAQDYFANFSSLQAAEFSAEVTDEILRSTVKPLTQ